MTLFGILEVCRAEAVGDEIVDVQDFHLGAIAIGGEDFDISPGEVRGLEYRLAAAATGGDRGVSLEVAARPIAASENTVFGNDR